MLSCILSTSVLFTRSCKCCERSWIVFLFITLIIICKFEICYNNAIFSTKWEFFHNDYVRTFSLHSHSVFQRNEERFTLRSFGGTILAMADTVQRSSPGQMRPYNLSQPIKQQQLITGSWGDYSVILKQSWRAFLLFSLRNLKLTAKWRKTRQQRQNSPKTASGRKLELLGCALFVKWWFRWK